MRLLVNHRFVWILGALAAGISAACQGSVLTTSTTGTTGGPGGASSTGGTGGFTTGTGGVTAGTGGVTAGTGGAPPGTGGASTSSGVAGAPQCATPADCPSDPVPPPCSTPACTAGLCGAVQLPAGAPCPAGVCDGTGLCVACLTSADCPSGVCLGNQCMASCGDAVHDGAETDIDCGGPNCPACTNGKSCLVGSDCLSQGCAGGVCAEVVLITEVRSNGPHASAVDDTFADDFVELYNPGAFSVVLDASWKLYHRSAQGSCQGKEIRYMGNGVTLPPHHHLLLGGLSYAGPPEDAPLAGVAPGSSIADAGSLWIEHAGQRVDALCYYFDQVTKDRLTAGCPVPYVCAGTPVSNLPHNGTASATSATDVSLARRVDAQGVVQSTGDNAADFVTVAPSQPENLLSPPSP
jgi:hypothetical protein